jgi:heterogeneous nuclear ribonucleoprotein A1/A3
MSNDQEMQQEQVVEEQLQQPTKVLNGSETHRNNGSVNGDHHTNGHEHTNGNHVEEQIDQQTTNTPTTETKESVANDSSAAVTTNGASNESITNGSKFEPEHFRKVFIGSLSYSTTDEALRNYFAKYGEIVDCVIMKENKTSKSRGFGFVTYVKSEMVDELMKGRPHRLDGRELETKRATPREDSGRPGAETTTRKLFIGAIKDGITEETMREYFGKYGKIEECVIMKDKDSNKSRGFGFITFDDYDPVDKIVLEKYHTLSGHSIAVKKAMPKDVMPTMSNGSNHNQHHHNHSNGRQMVNSHASNHNINNHHQPRPQQQNKNNSNNKNLNNQKHNNNNSNNHNNGNINNNNNAKRMNKPQNGNGPQQQQRFNNNQPQMKNYNNNGQFNGNDGVMGNYGANMPDMVANFAMIAQKMLQAASNMQQPPMVSGPSSGQNSQQMYQNGNQSIPMNQQPGLLNQYNEMNNFQNNYPTRNGPNGMGLAGQQPPQMNENINRRNNMPMNRNQFEDYSNGNY